MKETKNIERLFQEKFKNFEETPPQHVWSSIEKKLQQKKKRRIIPFWLKASGIAASLLLGISIYNFNASDSIVETKENEPSKSTNTISKENNSASKITNENEFIEKNTNTKKVLSNIEKNIIANSTPKKHSTSSNQKKSDSYYSYSKNNTQNIINSENKIIENQININQNSNNLFVANNSDFQKKINESTIASQEKAELKSTQDSSIVAKISEEVDALEQLLKEKVVGLNADEKEKENKWGVSSHLAPVYFNSLTKGSPLGVQFVDNKKSYASTLSYGVGFQYEIINNLSIRTGFNNLILDYNTNDVSYTTSMSNEIDDKTALRKNENGKSIIFIENPKSPAISGDVENFSQNTKAILNQKTSYFEIPVELSYKLLDKKFSIEVIGGMSTLFLNENSVSLIDNNMEMKIGEANNLNSIHFSGNFGLGFKYNFLKSLEANINPMYKYQFNNYSNNIENFKPYVIGLYTGIVYTF